MRITNSQLARKLIYMQIYIVLYIRFFISILRFPTALKYLTDGVTIILFFILLLRYSKVFKSRKDINILIIIFLLFTMIGAIYNVVPIHLFLWGLRNIFRFYIFYLAILAYLRIEDVKKILNIILNAYWVNLIITIIEYFIFNIRGDYLGGIFGTEQGCNGISNLFICAVLALIFSLYINKNIKLSTLIIYSLSFFAIASLAELKVCYFEYIMILALVILFAKPSLKTFILIFVSMFSFIIGIWILSIFFPDSVAQLLDFDTAASYLSEKWREDISFTRTNLISLTVEYFFKTDLAKYFLGYGLGACEVSSYFTSNFYSLYGDMNYRMYGVSNLLLQTGFIGLGLYMMYYIIQVCSNYKKIVNINVKNRFLPLWIRVLAILSIFLTFYGYATLEDFSYVIFFFFAIPQIIETYNGVLEIDLKLPIKFTYGSKSIF